MATWGSRRHTVGRGRHNRGSRNDCSSSCEDFETWRDTPGGGQGWEEWENWDEGREAEGSWRDWRDEGCKRDPVQQGEEGWGRSRREGGSSRIYGAYWAYWWKRARKQFEAACGGEGWRGQGKEQGWWSWEETHTWAREGAQVRSAARSCEEAWAESWEDPAKRWGSKRWSARSETKDHDEEGSKESHPSGLGGWTCSWTLASFPGGHAEEGAHPESGHPEPSKPKEHQPSKCRWGCAHCTKS